MLSTNPCTLMKKPALIYTILVVAALTLLLIVLVGSCHSGSDPDGDDLRDGLSSSAWVAPASEIG